MAYLLDANVFITANNLHYGMDFCPGFWNWLVLAHEKGDVFSIEKVDDELLAGEDELSEWAKEKGFDFFLRPDATLFPALAKVSEWAINNEYEPSAINSFLQVADYFLVSQALAGNHTVVTHEVTSASKKKIKIPDVCIGMNIKCVTPFQMLRREKVKFVLKTK